MFYLNKFKFSHLQFDTIRMYEEQKLVKASNCLAKNSHYLDKDILKVILIRIVARLPPGIGPDIFCCPPSGKWDVISAISGR